MIDNQQLTAFVADRACNYNIVEFVNGQQDCKNGISHKNGMTESYSAGYSCQYELEQINSIGFN